MDFLTYVYQDARFRKCKHWVHLHCCWATKYCVLLTTM